MQKLSAERRFAAVCAVINKEKKLYQVCKEFEVSRQTLRNWILRYQHSPNISSLANKHVRGYKHHNKLSWYVEKLILDLVIKNPDETLRGILQKVNESGCKISLHGVFNVLGKHELSTCEQRRRFSLNHPLKTLFSKTLSPAYKVGVVEEYLNNKVSVSSICRKNNLSSKTFYKWLSIYREAESAASVSNLSPSEKDSRIVEAFIPRYQKGYFHHKKIDQTKENHILNVIKNNPELSVHKIHAALPTIEGKPIIGHRGVQNFIEKSNLNTLEKRLIWTQGIPDEATEIVPAPIAAPALRRNLLIRIIAPFTTIPKLLAQNPVSWPFAFPVIFFIAYIFEIDKVFRVAVFFPIIALSFGMIFFLYSMKYYISLLMVVWLGANAEKLDDKPHSLKINISNYIKKIIKAPDAIGSLGMVEDISNVELSRKPFISVQVPVYNEKNVIERMLKAVTSFKWHVLASKEGTNLANYEVIIIDDSTDETTSKGLNYLSAAGYSLNKSYQDEKLEIVTGTSQDDPNKPIIKYIHRFSRSGFKGAALGKALEETDKRSEYVVIFDADFVPYADTLEQFVKHFALIEQNQNINSQKIAAIQGYQWHVLNKSENWITRGVRSEYAGSYVVERSAIELYGGLKMIAGSVYAIKRSVLDKFGWGTSITEDLELTLKLYTAGYKVAYTPYIQAPAEAVSTLRRLIRQRMRWAEGHSFNIHTQFKTIAASSHLTFREKLEFAFLAPYYLQAAFFIVGTFAWFLSEVIFKVNLPYWSAALGWSLVFSNFLALPLTNLLGLFLEQSEEKDYVGVASFVLLSYLVAPFQAYAAVKGFLEKAEGPWFRTPKSGIITDTFGRLVIGRWSLSLPFGKPTFAGASEGKPAPVAATVSSNLAPSFVSAFNPLSGYNIRPRRISLVSRSVLAVFLVVIMLLNYLAFFVQPKNVEAAGTPKIEQQINIIDQEYCQSASQTFGPSDNSLGWFKWEPSKYSDISSVSFEIVGKRTAGTALASLFDSNGNEVLQSEALITGASYARSRVNNLGGFLTANETYTVRSWNSEASQVCIQAARLIIFQVGNDNDSIKLSQTHVEVGGKDTINSASSSAYAQIADPKLYCFDEDEDSADNAVCDGRTTSRWSPAPTVYFEATIMIAASGDTVSVDLNSDGTASEAEVTYTGSTNWTLVRDTGVTMMAGDQYNVRIKCTDGADFGSNCSASIANARIIFEQDATVKGGIQALETMQLYNNREISTTSQTPARQNFDNYYDVDNFSTATINRFAESTMRVSAAANNATVYTKLCTTSEAGCSVEISTTSASATRKRSAAFSPTDNNNYDSYIRCQSDAGNCSGDSKTGFSDSDSWMVIQLSSIPVPEIAILALPAMFALPKIVAWWRANRGRRREALKQLIITIIKLIKMKINIIVRRFTIFHKFEVIPKRVL